jgi:hypothetical protein
MKGCSMAKKSRRADSSCTNPDPVQHTQHKSGGHHRSSSCRHEHQVRLMLVCAVTSRTALHSCTVLPVSSTKPEGSCGTETTRWNHKCMGRHQITKKRPPVRGAPPYHQRQTTRPPDEMTSSTNAEGSCGSPHTRTRASMPMNQPGGGGRTKSHAACV